MAKSDSMTVKKSFKSDLPMRARLDEMFLDGGDRNEERVSNVYKPRFVFRFLRQQHGHAKFCLQDDLAEIIRFSLLV